MWTVVEHLPEGCLRQGFQCSEQDVEIEGRHTFDPHEFDETWRRPLLRHRQLTKLVRQVESFELGNSTEVLLCMIPAFSYRDLLPNHVMLQLILEVGHGQGWVETAHCYNRLLETSLETDVEESFCYSIIVTTVDFLCFACEPYDKFVTPQTELSTEIEDIVARFVSLRFESIFNGLRQPTVFSIVVQRSSVY